jgi:SIR2-like domain
VETADEAHYTAIAERLAGGRMIPFLGAGANLADRGEEPWEPGSPFLPNGSELAAYLIEQGDYPLVGDTDLMRVSQYLEAEYGEVDLYGFLRTVFGSEYRPTSLHRLLARVARHLHESKLPQLVLATTNYDDLIERALADEGLECDVVWYDARERSKAHGRFLHRAPGADEPVAITRPNKYAGLPVTLARPAVLKLHGALDHGEERGDSYVITEDSYIAYLSGRDLGSLLPIALWQRMTSTGFLFLGYALRDWNLRVILNRIWQTQELTTRSWAVQREPPDANVSRIEQTLWDKRSEIRLVFCPLGEYARELEARMPFALPAATAAAR